MTTSIIAAYFVCFCLGWIIVDVDSFFRALGYLDDIITFCFRYLKLLPALVRMYLVKAYTAYRLKRNPFKPFD